MQRWEELCQGEIYFLSAKVRKPNSLGTGWDQLWDLNPGDVRNQGVPQRLGQVRPWNLKAFIRPGLGR